MFLLVVFSFILLISPNIGVIHILNPVSRQFVRTFQGYGSSINELKTHPLDPWLIVGTSKDHTIRLWNIRTEACVAIFSGVQGHRDEVGTHNFRLGYSPERDSSGRGGRGVNHELGWVENKI